MKRIRRILGSVLVICLLLTLVNPAAVYAASTISSVSIRVGLKDFEPGDTLPDIVVGDKDVSDSAYVYTSSQYYSVEKAEWVTSKTKSINVGDSPRMKVWLEPVDYDSRRFKGGYQSSNVKITGGTFKSAAISSKKLVVTLDLNPVQGQFEAPEEAYWANSGYGRARWSMGDRSSSSSKYRYEAALYRGSSQIHKVEVSSTSYNFYPYMTKAGTYSFRVRVIPSDSSISKYGKKSEWTISDEVYLPEEDVSDGTGQNSDQPGTQDSGITASGGVMTVGWIQSGNRWYFRYPDGSYPKDEWLAWNGKWYLFDNDGWMLTGWQNRNGYSYYLDDSGAMVTGWVQAGNTFYYLNPTQDQYEGVLVKNNWIQQDGNYYYLNQDGIRAEGWNQIDGNWYYFYPGTGVRAANTYIDGFPLDANGIWHK
ncbi:MAG: N-acetylmuramoyl-L-alanine amidase family protein [Lachnospiraceae bacterium]|nr:N-acetylmuramoyl-L-alanine amidase family protein [Lachnospiraceae bacterium]